MVEILRCPLDKSTLVLQSGETRHDDEIENGTLVCEHCERGYPIVKYVPRFVEDASYSESFGFEWRVHRRTQMPDSPGHETAKTFDSRTGFSSEGALDGALVLDAGCGVGRYMSVALELGAEVVGVDLSTSVDQTMENVGHLPNCHVVQADLSSPPFAEDTFDYLFSLGVLHHMPDPFAGFQALTPLLRPAGDMAVSVYPRTPFYTASQRLRKITTRMNKRVLYALTTAMTVLLYPVYSVPFLKLLYPYAPISMNRKFAWRRLDTFDCYSPKYQHTYTYYQVFQWFKTEGFMDIEVLESDVSVRGRKRNPSE